MSETKRTRKTTEEMVAELEAKLEAARAKIEERNNRVANAYDAAAEAVVKVNTSLINMEDGDYAVSYLDDFQTASRELTSAVRALGKLRD